MEVSSTLLLNRTDVATLLTLEECMGVVETAFKIHSEGGTVPPKLMGIHTEYGGFHIKAGLLGLSRNYFVAKINANFPRNPKEYALPTIQGIIVVCDGSNGRLLAVMDSIEITIIRTGAATAIAGKYLSASDAGTITICGCGNQGRISLKALMLVRKLKKAYAFDIDKQPIKSFITDFSKYIKIIPVQADQLKKALRDSQIIVTCTPSKKPFIHAEDISPGAFIAAVGADSEDKQELYPELIASSKIVVDLTEQSAQIGELHHAINTGVASTSTVHAELGWVIAGKKAGRESDTEVIVFDSTGTALQDAAAAALVYEKALFRKMGLPWSFSEVSTVGRNQKDINALKGWFPFR